MGRERAELARPVRSASGFIAAASATAASATAARTSHSIKLSERGAKFFRQCKDVTANAADHTTTLPMT